MRFTPSKTGQRRFPPFDVPSLRNSRRDLIVTVIVTVALLATATIVLLTGTAAGSDFQTAKSQQPEYPLTAETPTQFTALWARPSADEGKALVTRGNAVTIGDNGELIGRNIDTGEQEWSYQNAGKLCAATFYADNVVGVYNGANGCSDVTSISPTKQVYSSTRQSAFSPEMTLMNTWELALALSPERLEIWRLDLVRTVEYGKVYAPAEAKAQPRTGCTFSSAGLNKARFAVSERCPGESTQRLTISKTDPSDSRKPEEISSAATNANQLWVIGVTDSHVLVLQESSGAWTVEAYRSATDHTTVLKLSGEPSIKPSPQALGIDNTQMRWFDGTATHAFSADSGAYQWTVRNTTGPGVSVGYGPGKEVRSSYASAILPTTTGFSVVGAQDGNEQQRVQLNDDKPKEAIVGLSQVRDVLVEQRAGMMYAYKMAF